LEALFIKNYWGKEGTPKLWLGRLWDYSSCVIVGKVGPLGSLINS